MDVVCEQTLKTLSFLQQCLAQQLNYLGQNDCKSTLWTANRGDTSISAVEVRETDAEIVLQAKIPYVVAETLCIQAMPETLCLMGACQVASQISADLFDLKDTVGLPQFQHVIPLPVLIDPNTRSPRLMATPSRYDFRSRVNPDAPLRSRFAIAGSFQQR